MYYYYYSGVCQLYIHKTCIHNKKTNIHVHKHEDGGMLYFGYEVIKDVRQK